MKKLSEVGKKGNHVTVEISTTNCQLPKEVVVQEIKLFEPIKPGNFIKKMHEQIDGLGIGIGNTITSITQSEASNVFIATTAMYKVYRLTF